MYLYVLCFGSVFFLWHFFNVHFILNHSSFFLFQNQFCPLRVTTYLGSGQFGTVHQAVLSHQGTEIDVAVKTLKHEASEEEKIKFLQEAATMGQFHNTNVVKLFGVVTDNPKNVSDV